MNVAVYFAQILKIFAGIMVNFSALGMHMITNKMPICSVGRVRTIQCRPQLKNLLCSKNILTELVAYLQPTCLCVKMEFLVGTISLFCEFTFVEVFSFMWVRHNCVRKAVCRFRCAVLWELHS